MKYPEFPKNNSVIGICAPSAGVGDKIDSFEESLTVLRNEGYRIFETDHVRTEDMRSADAKTRAEELMSLFLDPEIDVVMSAAGGDFAYEIAPYIQWDVLCEHPKWLSGYSDPTSLLFPYTVKYDVATIYGRNAGSFDYGTSQRFIRDDLKLRKGKRIYLHNYPYRENPEEPGVFNLPDHWESTAESVYVRGRCIGGCIDVLKDLIGTPLDAMSSFNEKYKDDGTIFFFDNFGLNAQTFYNTLLQMKYAGWFDYTKAVIVGRTLFPSEYSISYEEAMRLALPDIPVIYNADIGHTKPSMTMIMGAVMNLKYSRGKATISFDFR